MPDAIEKAAGQGQNRPVGPDVIQEQSAQGDAGISAGGDRIVQVPAGQPAPMPGQQPEATPSSTEQKPQGLPPELEEMRKNMTADYTRKTQEVSEQRKALEREAADLRAREAAMRVQMEQQQQSTPGPSAPTLKSQFTSEDLAQMDPDGRKGIEAVDQSQQALWAEMQRQNQELQQQVQQLAQYQVYNTSEVRGVKVAQDVQGARAKYGNELAPFEQQAQQMAMQHGLPFQVALDQVAPQLRDAYNQRIGAKQALEQQQKAQQAQASTPGAFPGGGDVSEEFKEGESMQDSARRAQRSLGMTPPLSYEEEGFVG
jgi:hypothetical protein